MPECFNKVPLASKFCEAHFYIYRPDGNRANNKTPPIINTLCARRTCRGAVYWRSGKSCSGLCLECEKERLQLDGRDNQFMYINDRKEL